MSGMTNRDRKQAGMVSILVTMLLMIIISLIVLGFAQISRRNQRQSLDRQLSTQAYYAAETGINDIRDLINQALATSSTVYAKPDCTNGTGPAAAQYATLPSASLDGPNKVAYTCALVNPAPNTLSYEVGATGTVVPVISGSGSIANIKLDYKSTDTTTTPSNNCPTSLTSIFSTTSSWTCGYGVVRVDFVPTAGSGLTAAGLQSTTKTVFLVPRASGGVGTLDNGSWVNRWGVPCDNTHCTFTISGLSTSQYYMRISSLYKDVSMKVSATNSSAAVLSLSGAQAVVDVTGKAQDVLRRVQVRVPLTASSANLLSDYSLETTDPICKRFVGMDTFFQSYAATAVPGLISTPANPFCQ